MDTAADLALYVRLISGTVLGLAVAKLLSGLAKFVQHPQQHRMNILHGLWAFFIFGAISVFWWAEAQTFGSVVWSYPLYLFQIAYCSSYLFMTAVLLPDEVKKEDGHANHYEYFIARRGWFFGTLIISHLLDLGNTVIKFGWDELSLTPRFFVLHGVIFALLILGICSGRRSVQIAIAALFAVLTVLSMVLE
jgi:hypothetical protein